MGQAPELHPIQEANEEEVELYYEVEKKMAHDGELKMTKEEIEDEINTHHCLYFLKNHDHFHIFTFLAGSLAFALSYLEFIAAEEFNAASFMLTFAGVVLYVLTWMIYHPRLAHEREVRKYFREHAKEFKR